MALVTTSVALVTSSLLFLFKKQGLLGLRVSFSKLRASMVSPFLLATNSWIPGTQNQLIGVQNKSTVNGCNFTIWAWRLCSSHASLLCEAALTGRPSKRIAWIKQRKPKEENEDTCIVLYPPPRSLQYKLE